MRWRATCHVLFDNDAGRFKYKLTLCCSHLTLKFAFLLGHCCFIVLRIRIGEGIISRGRAV
jgi:hypothetical protein